MKVNDLSVFTAARQDKEFETTARYVEDFFPNFYDKKRTFNGVVLKYRRGQSRFARQIMSAIRENQILVIQAGVGIGKTVGYLIPLFYTYQNVREMEHFVISTSNIGLQQQLLTDINMISNMLGIQLNAVIAKGINNYACINRIQHALRDSRNSEDEKAIIQSILSEINEKNTIDKDEIRKVGDEVWELIKLKNRGACSKCSYAKTCLYRKIANEVNKANIVVTNHNIFAKSILEGRTFVKHADVVISDEAHQFENAIREIQGGTLSRDKIASLLNEIRERIIPGSDRLRNDYIYDTIGYINSFFGYIGRKEYDYYCNSAHINELVSDIVGLDKLPLHINSSDKRINLIMNRLNEILNFVKDSNYRSNYVDYLKEQLEKWIYILKDMALKDDSKNIYWIDFFGKNKGNIGYTSKKVSDVTNKLLSLHVPVIFTSGTLSDSDDTYGYFKNGLALGETNKNDATAIPSPYNYEANSLFYYDKNISDPNENHQQYLNDLVVKITELLNITHGRTLVLFTSKSDMNYVYSHLDKNNFDFDILLQGQEKSNHQLYTEFAKKSKTCLFSTGAWEGLDVKGKSLSSVIITRLPFATDNAIMQYKQREYKNDNDSSVFINDMIQKLAQGTGRLNRSSTDKGIICCLDSRFSKYAKYIQRVLPFTYYTDDLGEADEFAKKNITNMDGPRGPYKKRTKKEDN